MKQLEQALSNSSKVRPNSNELKQSTENVRIENPRKLPRRRSPSAEPAMTTLTSEAQAMEADEPPQHQSNKAEKQEQQLTPGESAILAALGRLEGRMTTLEERMAAIEVNHGSLATRMNALEVKQKYGTPKRERTEKIKDAISKRRGRRITNQKDEAETTQ